MNRMQVGEVVEFRRGISWSSVQEFHEARPGLVPVLRIPNIQDRLDDSDLRWLKGITQSQRQRYAASKDWILMVGSNGNPDRIGDSVRIEADSEYLFASFLVGLRPDVSRVDPRYLAHRLHAEDIRSRIRLAVRGSTGLQNINLPALSSCEIDLPSLGEQRRAADILDSLDDQIAASEQLIRKLKLESQATLVELMTSGLHAAQSTPRAAQSTGFPTESRALPSGWDLASIDSLLAAVQPAMRSGPFGSALLKHELVNSGVPLLGIDNVHVDRFESNFTRFVTPQKAQQLFRYLVRPSDIMITIMGTVGRCCLVPEDIGDALSSKHVWTITLDQSRYLPYLACKQLNYAPWARAHLRRDEQGGIMGAIRSETLRSLMLPVPPIKEQCEIAAVLVAVDRRVAAESARLEKLRPLKSGLMSDLLTGRVRVPAEVAS